MALLISKKCPTGAFFISVQFAEFRVQIVVVRNVLGVIMGPDPIIQVFNNVTHLVRVLFYYLDPGSSPG